MRSLQKIAALPAFAVPLLVYLLTLCPTVFVGDSGELATAATRLEISHPPGYPLLTVIGHLWSDIFFFLRPIVALNLFSAVCAAFASLLLFMTMRTLIGATVGRSRRLLPNEVIALANGWLLAFGHTLWSTATSFEVYALSTLLVTAAIYCWLRFYLGRSKRWLFLGAYLLGLILTNHLAAIVIAPLPLAIMITRRKQLRWGSIVGAVLLFLLPLSLYYYLVLRAQFDLLLQWYNPQTWAGFKQLVFAQTYQQRFLTTPVMADLMPFLRQLWRMISEEWLWPALVLALPGIYLTIRRHLALGVGLLSVVVLNIVLTLSYNIIDLETYYLPSLAVIAIWIGITLIWLGGRTQLVRWLAAAAALLLVVSVTINNYSSCDLSDRHAAETYGRDLMAQVPPDGRLFCASDMSLFPTLYLRYVEQVRPDLEVYGVLSTLVKLRRDLGLEYRLGYNSLPALLGYTVDSTNQKVVLARDPMQFDHLLTLLPNPKREGLVATRAADSISPAAAPQLDWRRPPKLYDPKEAVLYAQYYLLEAERAETEAARQLVDAAIDLIAATEQPILLTALASYLVDNGQPAAAGRVCAEALELATLRQRQQLVLWLLQAKASLGIGDRWQAGNLLRKVLELDPANQRAQVMQLRLEADAAIEAQDYVRAVKLQKEMIEIDPGNTQLYLQLGRLYLNLGQSDFARQMFEICNQRGLAVDLETGELRNR